MLDNFIFDSQFLFLKQDEKLMAAYKEQALRSAMELDLGGSKAYVRAEEWDSEKFNRSTGRLLWIENKVENEIQHFDILEELRDLYDCTYIRLNQNHSFCKASKINGLPVLSAKVSQNIDLGSNEFPVEEGNYIEYTENTAKKESILQFVLKLAEGSFRHNRFRADDHFTETQVNDIYRSWIVNEIKNKSSKLFVALHDNKVAAFFLYKENISPLPEYRIGFVGLIASDPEHKEKNYATNLLNFVLSKAKQDGTQYVVANTETKNTGAINFFKKNNFKVTSYLNEYHIWA